MAKGERSVKISPTMKGYIYGIVRNALVNLRIDLRMNYLQDNPMKDKVDSLISQIEAPLAQDIIKLIVGKTKDK